MVGIVIQHHPGGDLLRLDDLRIVQTQIEGVGFAVHV
jgi:hypothetical protein